MPFSANANRRRIVKLDTIIDRALSRRSFLAGAGSIAATALVAGCGSNGKMPGSSSSVSDADILNFALNLEYLEAEFYLRAATGSGLASADVGSNPGAVTGGAKVGGTLSTAQQNILNEIAYDEQEHVRFLRSALTAAGATPVVRPAIDLTNSFNTLAMAAGIASTFNPFADFNSFLVGAFIFEDVGVTAYNGAATLISTAGIKAGYLGAAAGIMAVEAYHAAYVRTSLTANAATQGTSAYPYFSYANKVAALRASVGGGNETMLTVPSGTTTLTTTVTPTAVVAADSNALAYARTTDQVLHIVYGTGGGSGVKSGAFFPSGLNGKITATQS